MAKQYTFSSPPRPDPKFEKLLPNIVDEAAAIEPDAVWGEITVSPTSYEAGFRPITWKALANAINGLAGILESSLGRSDTFETVAYLGPSDPRTPMMVVAGVKVGYKTLLSSPRNSLAAHENLFQKLQCRAIITTTPPPPFVTAILKAVPEMQLVKIPSIDELLSTPYTQYPYNKTYEDAKHDQILCLHTSGSTGLPKPLVYQHEFWTGAVNIFNIQPPDGYDLLNNLLFGTRKVVLFPLFHMAGIYFSLFSTIIGRDPLIFPLATVPPTGATLGAILEQTGAEGAFIAPTQAEDLTKDDKLLDLVASKLKLLVFAGGGLIPSAGEKLSSRLHLRCFLGSSEYAALPHIIPKGATSSGDDWPYMEFHPYSGVEYQPRDDDSSELVIQRRPEYKPWQTIFMMFPETDEFHSQDIFKPHPSKRGLWSHQGREDDIIVFSNGEKTNPLSFEATVSSCPEVKAALVFGTKRFEPGILVELESGQLVSSDPAAQAQLLDQIHPALERANKVAPAHARIAKSHVIFATPDKPFLRSGKGSVQRQLTLDAYMDEMDALYDSMDPSKKPVRSMHAPQNNALSGVIRQALGSDTNLSITADEQDLFELGLDSLQATRLARRLRIELKSPDIDPSLIYANPSVRSLASALGQTNMTNGIVHDATVQNRTELVYEKHKAYMDVLASCLNTRVDKSSVLDASSHVVVLTGSTGFLGRHVLQSLLSNSAVSHVCCLNRRAVPATSSSRVTHIQADFTNPSNFGLPSDVYDHLLSSVTLIIHAAWPVDFIQNLTQFETALAATTHLSLFAARAAQRPGVLYVSSVSAVMNLKDRSQTVPSEVVRDSTAPIPGYGESKHVAERLVDHAACKFGVQAGIARLGQIAGPVKSSGDWNEKEWLPRLIRSSRTMGMLPNSLGATADVIDWIAVDEVADILVDLGTAAVGNTRGSPTASGTENPGARVFNVVNPHPTTWQDVLGNIQGLLGSSTKLVDRASWLAQLRRVGDSMTNGDKQSAQILANNPALPLEEFYRRLFADEAQLRMDTHSTQDASKIMRNLPKNDGDVVERWVRGILKA